MTIINTCMECGRVFESTVEKNFCSSPCRWEHDVEEKSQTKKNDTEKKRIEEMCGKARVLPFFEDVIL